MRRAPSRSPPRRRGRARAGGTLLAGLAFGLHLYGGIVRFGRLYMVGTNLQIADAFPKDPFEFYLVYYQNQLAAGYSRSHLDDSLTTYMPDFPLVGKTVEPGERIGTAKP